MTTIKVVSNGKLLCIEICETWDFVRDVHSYQAHVVDKEAMLRYIIGRYNSCEKVLLKANEQIKENISQ